jgi:hypothetical protein
VNIALDDGEDCVALGFDEESCLFVLGPQGKSSGELTARLFTSKLEKSREYLLSQGVSVGEVEQDGQGTHFFKCLDVEGETPSRFPRSPNDRSVVIPTNGRNLHFQKRHGTKVV